jgi:hypothetical protein
VQTPYRYFPVEPHWVMPGFQFLPLVAKRHASNLWPIGNYSDYKRSEQEAIESALTVELLTKTEMRYYFPESAMLLERVAGLTKSLIAVA